MNGFTPANGTLLTADQHRLLRRDTADQLHQYLRGLDTVERLRMMALARDYYRDNLAAMVHTIIAAGGDLIDIAWLTQDSIDRVRAAWIDWARTQVDDDDDWNIHTYRHVADAIGVLDQFDSDMEKLFSFDRANGRDTTWYQSPSNNDINGTHRN